MKLVRAISFFLMGTVIFGALSVVKPALAVTVDEIKNISAGLDSNAGMIASATELVGADSDLVKKFQLGVKYGEFYARLSEGDYWGVAADFIKFELGREVDTLTDMASKKLLSAGAQRLAGVFTALKDAGIWLGNKALDMQFNAGVKVGYEEYRVVGGDPAFMQGWWTKYGNAKKLRDVGDFDVWMDKFAKIYALEKQLTAAPPTTKDIAATEKTIKKAAVVDFFKLKYPGIGINVAEELADAIVNKAGSAAIQQIAEKYKNHLDTLTAAGPKSEGVSSSDMCGAIKKEDDRKECEKMLVKIVNLRNQVLSNKTTYYDYFNQTDSMGVSYRWSIGEENLAKFKKSQEDSIASAYELQFGQEMRAITSSLAAHKDRFQSLKDDYNNLPKQGEHWRMPSYKVSVNTGFTRVFNNMYNTVFHYGSFSYNDFKNGDAQTYYQEFLENEPKANAVDDARVRYVKAYLVGANSLVRDLTSLQNRINAFISSAESAQGVFDYGHRTIDDLGYWGRMDNLKKMVSEIEELKKEVQSGEKHFWIWRWGAQNINSALETIKEMEDDKKTRESSIAQLKKENTSALNTYEEEEKQLKLEEQKQAEEEKKEAAEKEARALQKQKSEEETWSKEKERLEAEKKAAAEKIKSAQDERTKAFSVPFGESPKTSNKVTPPTPTGATQTVTPKTKPTPPPAQPPAPKKSTLPSGETGIPHYYREISGFSFIAGWKADMMASDFFWNDDGISTLGDAKVLKLTIKSIDGVASVPTSGYGDGPYQPEVGHVYAIKTRGGKYGIIQIQQINAGNVLYFYWKYQPDGSTSFTSTKSTLSPTPTQAPAEKTAEPIQCSIFNSNYAEGNPDGCPIGTFIATVDILTIVNISGNSVTFENSAKKQTIKNSGDTMQVASNATAVIRVQNGRLYFDNVVIH